MGSFCSRRITCLIQKQLKKKAYDGGAILYSLVGSSILVEKCSFFNCSASHYTAAIRVTSGNGIIAYVCGQYCKSGNNDAFSSVSLDKTIQYNFILDSSISHCETSATIITYHDYGFVHIKSTNYSHNSAREKSAIESKPNKAGEEPNVANLIDFSTFSNNTAKTQYCIQLTDINYNTAKQFIRYSNIIENNATYTFCIQGKVNITHCCILQNGNPCFRTKDSYAEIFLINCTIDNTNETGSGDVKQIGSITSFINGLTFISTGSCHASFDVVGSLSPSVPTKNSLCNCKCTQIPQNYFSISYHTLNCMFFLFCIYSF